MREGYITHRKTSCRSYSTASTSPTVASPRLQQLRRRARTETAARRQGRCRAVILKAAAHSSACRRAGESCTRRHSSPTRRLSRTPPKLRVRRSLNVSLRWRAQARARPAGGAAWGARRTWDPRTAVRMPRVRGRRRSPALCRPGRRVVGRRPKVVPQWFRSRRPTLLRSCCASSTRWRTGLQNLELESCSEPRNYFPSKTGCAQILCRTLGESRTPF